MTVSAITTVAMPRLSDSMEDGVIVSWLVADGDEVEVGQEIVEVETDKATMPYEAEAGGKIHLRAAEGDTVRVGDVIALIGELDSDLRTHEGGERSAAQETRQPTPASSASPDPAPSDADPARAPQTGDEASANGRAARQNASPIARRLAADLRVELSDLNGSGPGGRIVKADVEAAARVFAEAPPAATVEPKQPTPAPPVEGGAKGESTRQKISRVQSLIANRMAQSKATAPDFVLRMDVDMEAAVALRTQLREIVGPESRLPSFNDFVVKACAMALSDSPLANGSYEDGEFVLHSRVNVGIAVAARDTLVVPTIFDADQKSLGEIGRVSRRLIEKVRDGTITPPELAGGTFSVSNLGMFGVDEFSAVINPPQAAILAVGALKQRPVVVDGQLAPRHTMSISLSCDHRILYGANAAEFLAQIRRGLESPGSLVF